MLNQYHPNVKATIRYLKLLRVKVTGATVNETLQNHPDWPSLLCISDSLNKWNVPNAAGKIDINSIDELPVPFIAYRSGSENPLTVISEVNDSTVKFFQKNYSKLTIESKEDFLKKWNGVYLIAEPNEYSGERNYELNRRKSILNSLIPITAISLIAILSFIFVNMVAASASLHSTAIYLQYFILLAGVFTTALLLWYEIDKSNPLLQKVCTGIAKGNCSAILTGKRAKLFSWLSWSEVGFFYFTGGLLSLLFIENAISVIAWINLLALPYILFSVHYQWQVAKQWCVLCLAVQALLLLGGINVIVNHFLFTPPFTDFSFLFEIGLLYLLPVLAWYTVKASVLKLQEAKNTKREYLRIKFNAEIFGTLLKKQKKILVPADLLGIDLGNPAASNTIIKVCNPYCGPCAKAHPKIEALLEHNSNVNAKIIFSTPNDDKHPSIMPTRHLMAIASSGNNEQLIKSSLDDWYLSEKKDYESFAAKYPLNGELQQQSNKIEAMDKWCKATAIEFTPTIFVNGYQLPDAYGIEDLEYFLAE